MLLMFMLHTLIQNHNVPLKLQPILKSISSPQNPPSPGPADQRQNDGQHKNS